MQLKKMLQILPLFVRFSVTDIFKCLADMKKFVHKFANVHPPDSGICLFNVTGGLCGQNFGSSIVGNTLLSAHGGRLFMARVTLDAVFGDESSLIRGMCESMNHCTFGGCANR